MFPRANVDHTRRLGGNDGSVAGFVLLPHFPYFLDRDEEAGQQCLLCVSPWWDASAQSRLTTIPPTGENGADQGHFIADRSCFQLRQLFLLSRGDSRGLWSSWKAKSYTSSPNGWSHVELREGMPKDAVGSCSLPRGSSLVKFGRMGRGQSQ